MMNKSFLKDVRKEKARKKDRFQVEMVSKEISNNVGG